jgi:hypothetical protein
LFFWAAFLAMEWMSGVTLSWLDDFSA